MKGSTVVCAVAVMALGATALAESARIPKALVIMLDGCRADVAARHTAPNIRRLAEGQWMEGYNGAWTWTARTILDAPTLSGPNHATIATGVTSAKTKVMRNRVYEGDFAPWPTCLQRLVEAHPGKSAYFAFSWNEDANFPKHEKVTLRRAPDTWNFRDVPVLLAKDDAPDLTYFYIDMPDHSGHHGGYYPYAGDYLAAVRASDSAIGTCLDAIASRRNAANEDWLVIVTADHGGYHRDHGKRGGHEETIPLVVASRRVSPGRIPGLPFNCDVAPTVLEHFGIDTSGMGLDGRPVTGGEAAPPVRTLGDGLAAYLVFEKKQKARVCAPGVKCEILGGAATGVDGGQFGGCLRLGEGTNGVQCVRLDGTEKLVFENGADFTATIWVLMPKAQNGDPAIFSNKDWNDGRKSGVALVAGRRVGAAKTPGVCFNAGLGDSRKRLDMGTYDVDYGKWTFYAVTRSKDGVLTVYQGAPDGRLYWIADEAKALELASGLPFFVGQDGTGNYQRRFAGDIDDFALWTRHLPLEDIRRIYEAGREGRSLGSLL